MWQRSSVARVTWLLFAGYAWVFLGCALASGQDAVVAAAIAAPGLLTCVPIVATVAAVAAEDNTWAEPPPSQAVAGGVHSWLHYRSTWIGNGSINQGLSYPAATDRYMTGGRR